MKKGILLAVALALGALPAAADEITLINGRKIEGIESRDPAQPNKILVEVGSGTITLDAKEVSSVSRGRSRLHEFYEKSGALRDSKSARDLYELALWAKSNKCFKFVRPLCEKVVMIDPDHEGARKELGQEKVGGRWMSHDEAMAAKGLISFEGRWVTKAEKELVERQRLQDKERKLAAQIERERKKEEDLRRRQEALEDYHDWMARASRLPYGYLYQPNWFWPPYYRPYPWLPYQHKRPPNYGGFGSYWGDGGVTINPLDFVGNPFKKK